MNFKEALIAHLQGEKVECKATDSKWSDFVGCFGHISMDKLRDLTYVGWEFRLSPRTITVNGVDVPAPETVAPADGSGYYTPHVTREQGYRKETWDGAYFDLHVLEQGLVYLNKEDAIARSKAMLITQEAV